jgi:hypothetical protein
LISASSGLRTGAGEVLFQTAARVFDVAPDGRRFVLVLPNPALVSPGIRVVLDWVPELKEQLRRPN